MLASTLEILNRELSKALYETALMMLISTLIGISVGLLMGLYLYLTSEEKFYKNTPINMVIGTIVNIVRSIPFIILVVFSLPLTFLITGTKIGPIAASVPLSICATVFFARIVEGAFKDVDKGVIEAAFAQGASNFLIIKNVLLVEAAPAIVRGITITFISLIGFSAMAGMVTVPLDVKLTKYELNSILSDCEPIVMLVSNAHLQMALELQKELTCIKDIIVMDEPNSDMTCKSLYNLPDNYEARWRPRSSKSTAFIIYTSGTTGSPKGVEISFANMLV